MRVWPCIPHESGEILECSRHRSNSRPDTPSRDDAAGRQRFPATPRRARTLLPNPSANAFDRERERETPNCTGASPGSASHNSHIFETVTVYYRWHPLFGQSLRVYERKKERTGERTVCKLGDDSNLAIPSWMLNPECAQCSLGPPQISVEALMQLRHLLSALQLTPACDKPSLKFTHKEGVDEANGQSNCPTVQSVAGEHTCDSGIARQAGRTETRTDRAAQQRSLHRQRSSGQRR